MGRMIDQRGFKEYVRLLTDPCHAPFTEAPYIGVESGYYVRTKDQLQATFNMYRYIGDGSAEFVNNTGPVDLFFQYNPTCGYGDGTDNTTQITQTPTVRTFTAAFNVSGGKSGAALPLIQCPASNIGLDANPPVTITPVIKSNFTQSDIVAKRRPVASCVKWIPNGQYSTRSGTVSVGYVPSGIANQSVSDKININSVASMSMRTSANGSECHEVNWLPNSTDGDFGQNTNIGINGAAIYLALRGIDGKMENCHTYAPGATTRDGISGACTISLNGYFEVTTVWEWIPDVKWTIVQNPVRPLAFTLNDVLSLFSVERLILANTGQADEGQEVVTKAYNKPSKYAKGFPSLRN